MIPTICFLCHIAMTKNLGLNIKSYSCFTTAGFKSWKKDQFIYMATLGLSNDYVLRFICKNWKKALQSFKGHESSKSH